MKSSLILTERTSIDEIRLTDASFIQRLVNSPGWIEYIGQRDVSDVHAAEEYLKNGFLKNQDEYGFGYYVVKNFAGDGIGIAGFLKRDDLDYPDFGFAFMPQWSGQGYAYEASKAILNYGLEAFEFSELDAVTSVANISSQRLLLKLGFRDLGDVTYQDKKEMLFRLTFSR